MSMPSAVLRCEKCNQRANTCMLDQNFRYWYKGIDVRLSKSLGFCQDCENFAPVEDFQKGINGAVQAVGNNASSLLKWSEKLFSIYHLPFMRFRRAHQAQELTSNACFLAIALTRQGDERCLRCLSRNIIKFDGNIDLPYDISGVYVGKKPTGFHHPGCGGEFIVEGSDMRVHMGRKPHYFLVDGINISMFDSR